jgi:hypothetical protein
MTESPWRPPADFTLGPGETAIFKGEVDEDGTFIVRDVEKVPRVPPSAASDIGKLLRDQGERLTQIRNNLRRAFIVLIASIVINLASAAWHLWRAFTL